MTRYDGPVVDAHHHFWEPRLGHQPWLRPGARIPFRYGDYEAIKRDYLPEDLRADAASAGVRLVGSVTMETEWDETNPVGEMTYTAAIAGRAGLPNAAVAHALLQSAGVDATLEALASIAVPDGPGRPRTASAFVRGVRHKPGQAVGPAAATSTPTLLDDPAWERGYARLARHGLLFELQTAWWHLAAAAALARRHPDVPVVLNHAGLPADRSPEAMAGWRAATGAFAAVPHAVVKISGIGQPGVPWTAASNRPVVEHLVDVFGADRVLFASNFPVDSLAGSYPDVFGGFVELSSSWSSTEQRAAFAENAVRVYGLPATILHDAGAGAGAVAGHDHDPGGPA